MSYPVTSKNRARRPQLLMPEEMKKAIREVPRDAEVIKLLKNVSEEGPLPAR
jgi:hypothetical protein